MKLLVAAPAAFLLCSTAIATPGHAAPVGASDTATPAYVSSAAPVVGANEFKCLGSRCSLLLKTTTTPYPCSSELVVMSGVAVPALLYQNTFCSVSISGDLTAVLGEGGGPACELDGTQAMRVAFSSGANSTFNGRFRATATFRPTAVTTTRHVTRARITLKAGSQLESSAGTGTGAVTAAFDVAFGGAGLSPYCTASPTGLTTVTAGTVTTRY